MEFEFDPTKSVVNKEKHGIDFIEAQELWNDEDRVLIPAKYLDEARFLLIGRIGKEYWSAIYTIRNEKIRLISVRRSRKNEREIYKS